ncbi:MAG: sugar-binding domain-containing protein [Tissierellia bacterium]|nr:sugar-binding domain-containing protein [Tissierellia bacterium]
MEYERLRLLVKISKLYYYDNMSQKEIANKLFMSRSQIGRFLEQARNYGIVNIKVMDPFSKEENYREGILKKYGLDDIVVVETDSDDKEIKGRRIAEELSYKLNENLKDEANIGISAGTTIESCSRYTNIYSLNRYRFISLMGGIEYENDEWNSNKNCVRFAENSKGITMELNAPMVIRSKLLKRELSNDKSIKPVIDMYRNLDLSIIGIGEITENSTLGKSEMTQDEIFRAKEKGAVAVVCGSFLGADGGEVCIEESDNFFGAKLDDIDRCPEVIAVAYGLEKVDAIKATIRSGAINILYTDVETAELLLRD